MDISKLYTLTMHKALQNALRQGFRIDYYPAGGFIKHIRNNREGVIFNFNTWIGSHAGMTANKFLNYSYHETINDLRQVYNECMTDNTFQLKSEFYQDRYSIKF